MNWTRLSDGIAQARREMEARERRDIEQEEIARAVGVTKQAYSRWENGTRIPKEQDVQRLAKFFGVPASYLRYGVRDPTAAPTVAADLPSVKKRTRQPTAKLVPQKASARRKRGS